MKIKDIFVKDLSRKINGVVKAEQREPSVIRQELDEFVVTRELLTHIDKFFQTYLEFLDTQDDIAAGDRNGVWISGFFGSGKSHFLKILSYLLSNIEAVDPVTSKPRTAVDFLKDKIADPILFGNIRRAVGFSCDAILFNIDSKADVHEDPQAQLLSVFTKVFNELQGFCGQYPYVANLEYELQKEGLLEAFAADFESSARIPWIEARDSFHFRRDEIIESLKRVKNMSHDSAAKFFDGAEQAYTNSSENFSKRIKQYLQSKPANHRILFMIDEMGQFIGSDSKRMLKLQSIVEDLGTHCGGQAWLVVTSQEDIDATIGDMKAREKRDFSRIQGRFNCRISLSSANTDEVIRIRLLEKTPTARLNLNGIYSQNKDILNHKLSFTSDCSTLKNFRDNEDFINNYPFAPFHYQIIQKVFETVRTSGMAGAHLSRGERSMLDSFQIAAQKLSDEETGALVPLHSFYSAIEGFLDTAVKKTISQAAENTSLKPFDIEILKTLFLIRRIEEMIKPNVDNLVTLLVTEVDSDRLGIKKNLHESLDRLEKETLINRSGDHYFFLTNEERDVGTQIKNTEVSLSEEVKLLSELLYDEVIKAAPKHRYSVNKKDYGYNKLLDGVPHSSKSDNELTVEIVSPLSDDHARDEVYFLNKSTEDKWKIVFRLSDHHDLTRELRMYKKTEKFISLKYDSSGSPNFKSILEQRGIENRARKARLLLLLADMVPVSDCYVCGNVIGFKSSSPEKSLYEALEYLIKSAYPKLYYIKKTHDDPVKEIKFLLNSDFPTQDTLIANLEKDNPDAIQEMQFYMRCAFQKNNRIELTDIIKYFSSRPFGWSEWETIILLTRLFVTRRIEIILAGDIVGFKEAYGPLTKTQQWKQLSVQQVKIVDEHDLDKARGIGQKLFGKIGPENSEKLMVFLRDNLEQWQSRLDEYKIISNTGSYPGKKEIAEALDTLNKVLKVGNTYEFFKRFNESENDLIPLEEDMKDLDDFYRSHVPLWKKLQSRTAVYKQIQAELEARLAPQRPVRDLMDILSMPRPYGRLCTVETSLNAIDAVYNQILDEKRQQGLSIVDARISSIKESLKNAKADDALSNKALKPVQDIKKQIEPETSIPQVAYYLQQLESLYEQSLDLIDKSFPPERGGDGVVETVKLSAVSRPEIIQDEQQVNDFVDRLRATLLEKVKKSIKIKIGW